MKWYAILAACFVVGASGESLFELLVICVMRQKCNCLVNLFIRTECELGFKKYFTNELGHFIPYVVLHCISNIRRQQHSY